MVCSPQPALFSRAFPVHIYGTKNRQTSIVATDFLRANDRMASLLPAAMRMARLQSDCAAILPVMAGNTDVIAFHEGTLVLAVPSSAVAARMKQMVPKLQTALAAKGWPVESIRLKVQVGRAMPDKPQMRTLELPPTAVQAFEELAESLEETSQNKDLVAALRRLAEKRK
ncbi:hypothetical protein GCM10027317_02550 [Massilia agri]